MNLFFQAGLAVDELCLCESAHGNGEILYIHSEDTDEVSLQCGFLDGDTDYASIQKFCHKGSKHDQDLAGILSTSEGLEEPGIA